MMYPRLELLRDLLAEDGSIWVSIDDNEAHYLKVMMDEIFGRGNFVANVIWQKKYTIANDAKWLSDNHDHVLIHAKNKDVWRPNKLARTDEMNARYKNPDNHPKGVWKATPLHAKSGVNSSAYTFKNGIIWSPPAGTFRRFNDESMQKMDANNEIWFGRDGKSIPSRKTFLTELSNDGTPSPTVWLHTDGGHNHEAREEVKALNEENPFGTPKPERLIQRILQIATNENDLVLDSFLGSGTTAAVAHKMNRRYIGIEMGDHAQTHCQPRLKKVIDGEQGGISKAVNWTGGGGFRFYRLGSAVFDEYGAINPDISFATLAAHIWYIKTHTPLLTPADSPLLGIHNGVAYYLLYNGILKDRKPQNGNVLTNAVLASLPKHDGKKIIFGESTLLRPARLEAEQITFQQIPYDVGVF
jgi:adenine-specific DNA-methyltransferase